MWAGWCTWDIGEQIPAAVYRTMRHTIKTWFCVTILAEDFNKLREKPSFEDYWIMLKKESILHYIKKNRWIIKKKEQEGSSSSRY